jgi:hypothetical protein
MNNDSIEELEGRELERAAIVKWLRDRAAAWRQHPPTATHGNEILRRAHEAAAGTLADSIEGLAAAIERCAHRSGS